jgi:hypothetical protein
MPHAQFWSFEGGLRVGDAYAMPCHYSSSSLACSTVAGRGKVRLAEIHCSCSAGQPNLIPATHPKPATNSSSYHHRHRCFSPTHINYLLFLTTFCCSLFSIHHQQTRTHHKSHISLHKSINPTFYIYNSSSPSLLPPHSRCSSSHLSP